MSATSAEPKHIILVNRFFFPDQSPTSELLSDLALALAEVGYRVTAVTSRLRYDDRTIALPARDVVGDVEILRIWSFRSQNETLTGRTLEYLTFYLSAALSLWRLAKRGDVIIAKTDPPLLSLVAASVARLKGARLINWLQDLFPEVAEELGVAGDVGRPVFRFLRRLRNHSLRYARMNVVPGNWMATTLGKEGVESARISVIPNWINGSLIAPIAPEQSPLRKKWSLEGRIVVAYAGNFGRAHDFATLIETIGLYQEGLRSSHVDDPMRRIFFLLVGGGPQRKHLEDAIRDHKLENVGLYPYQPREQLGALLGVADIHLVSLKPELEGLIVPSKFYGIAAAGRPTIFIGSHQGEIASLIRDAQCGVTVMPGDGGRLLCAILELAQNPERRQAMGLRARRAFEAQWERRHSVARWQHVILAAFDEDTTRPAASRVAAALTQ